MSERKPKTLLGVPFDEGLPGEVDPEKERKTAERVARRERQRLVKELNAGPSAHDAMRHRLPGSFETGKRQ